MPLRVLPLLLYEREPDDVPDEEGLTERVRDSDTLPLLLRELPDEPELFVFVLGLTVRTELLRLLVDVPSDPDLTDDELLFTFPLEEPLRVVEEELLSIFPLEEYLSLELLVELEDLTDDELLSEEDLTPDEVLLSEAERDVAY